MVVYTHNPRKARVPIEKGKLGSFNWLCVIAEAEKSKHALGMISFKRAVAKRAVQKDEASKGVNIWNIAL